MLELVCTPPLSPVVLTKIDQWSGCPSCSGLAKLRRPLPLNADVLALQPLGAREPRALLLVLALDGHAHHVGERLVQRAGLIQVDEPRRERGQPVGDLVGDDVDGGGEVAVGGAADAERHVAVSVVGSVREESGYWPPSAARS